MGIQVILIVSIAFQLTAAGIALSLIRVTHHYRRTWFFIAAAALIMVFRRFTIFAQVLRGTDATSSRMTAEVLALVISMLLVLFMLHIRPLLRAIHQAHEELERHVKERTDELSRTTAALQHEIALRQGEEKFRAVFEYTPVSLWEEDFSDIKSYIDRLRADGVTDFRTYLAEHPDAVRECAARARVLNVNRATLDLLELDSKEALPRDLAWLLDLQPSDVFVDVFAGLAEGKTQVTTEEQRRTLTGAPLHTILGLSIAPGFEDTWGRVLVYVLDITERKRAEEALRASQTIQAAIIEAIPDMLFRFDREGRYLAAYTHQTDLLVASRDELIGNTIADALPPQVAQTAYHHLQQAFETGETQAFEYALPVLDGLHHFEARFAVSGADEIVAIVRDITDRKAADEALNTQRAFLRQVIDAIPSLVFAKDREGRYILGNQAMADRYKVTVDELVGKTDAELNPISEEVAQYRESDRAVLDTGQPQFIPVEAGRHALHSEPSWYQTIKVPLRSPDGTVEYLLGVATDITERKRAEDALATQRQYLREIIDVAPSVIFIKDPEGRYILANQALSDLAQMPVEDLIGKYDADFASYPEDRARREAEDRQVLETRQRLVIHEEQIVDRRNGERYWFKVTKVPIMAPDRDEFCVLVAAENITAHKLAEEQTIALALEKERSRILSDFIRDTSHEFGTPLAVMRTSLYVLDQMLEDPAQARHLQTVKKQVQYIENLVQNLLTMSRLDSGDEFLSQPIDLRWLLESIIERFNERLQARRMALHLDFEDGLPTINGDPKYLHAAFENVVDNAIHYTPPEGAITIRTRRQNTHVVVEVQDTGIGIPEDQHELIFVRFYRIDQARSDRGAGLGLPIARKIIDGHQGTITVDSAPGQGSIFRVFLPIPPG